MKNIIHLHQLKDGESAIVELCDSEPLMRRRLIDLGFAPKSCVQCLFSAPFGDPKAYLIKNTVIALRKEDSSHIRITQIKEEKNE